MSPLDGDLHDEVLATLAEARRGGDVARALLAQLRALDALPFSADGFEVARLVRLALLGGADGAGLDAVVAGERSRQSAAPRARLFRDGDPLTTAWPANPFGITSGESLDAALARMWRPCAAPRLVAALRQRTLGLVLFDDGATPQLGYVLIQERDEFEVPESLSDAARPAFERRAGLAWEPFGDVALVLAEPPLDGAPALRPGVVMPEPLRALYAVHAGLRSMWRLARPDGLMLWSEMLGVDGATVVRGENPDERCRADQLLSFFSYGDDRSDLFDLRDGSVRGWSDGGLWSGHGAFADWLDEITPLVVFAAYDGSAK